MQNKSPIVPIMLTSALVFTVLSQRTLPLYSAAFTMQNMTAFSQNQQDSFKIFINDTIMRNRDLPVVDNNAILVSARDMFGFLGYRQQDDKIMNTISFISAKDFFVIDKFTSQVLVNGKPIDLEISMVGDLPYIDVQDVGTVLPVTVISSDSSVIKFLYSSTSRVVVHYDNLKIFNLVGTYSLKGSSFFLGISSLQQVLLDSRIISNNDSISINSPVDGSFTTFYFDGKVEYSPANSSDIQESKIDPNLLYQDSKAGYLINHEYINKFTSYKITYKFDKDTGYIIDVNPAWNSNFETEYISVFDVPVPLSETPPISKIWARPSVELNVIVRDTGYIFNLSLADEIAMEINAYRQSYDLPVLGVNHSLVFMPQASDNASRNSAFDNLRWCRENSTDRSLEHMPLIPGCGEILMLNSKAPSSAAKLVNTWYNSKGHRDVIMDTTFKEFGIVVIQYPNGDIDISGLFYTGGK